jgi:predicted nuclease of predicted toxin-antitoxin system
MMRFLANENFPVMSVRYLRSAGYDVAYGSEDAPGAEDSEVLTRAVREGRIILTFDRDYGELIYRRRMPSPVGVVYFRYFPATPEEPAQDLLRLLSIESISLEGSFTVVERTQLRQRPLP